MTSKIPQRATSPPQIPHYNQIKGYIYTIRIFGIICLGVALVYFLHHSISQWLISVGFLSAGFAFITISILLKRFPALSTSLFTKRSRHGKDDNSYDK